MLEVWPAGHADAGGEWDGVSGCLHTRHGLQIVEKQSQLERAHCSLKELEQSLGRSEAERAAARADGEARVAALDARKAELEKQLRGASVAAAAARAQGVAARVHALEARLHVTRTAKASAEQRLQECRVRLRRRCCHMRCLRGGGGGCLKHACAAAGSAPGGEA